MPVALITGSNGFIGSHLAGYLLEQGFHVRCMVRKTSDLRWLDQLDVELVFADLSDMHSMEKLPPGLDFVFHCGGSVKALNREGFFKCNAQGTSNLIRAVSLSSPGLKRFVYVSSQAAGGPSLGLTPRKESDPPMPVTWYGESKLEGEKSVLEYAGRIPVTIIRPPSVYGPRDTDFFEIFRAVQKGIKPVLGWRTRCVSFIYIQDLVKGIVQSACADQAAGQTFYVVSDPVISWKEMVNEVAAAMQKRAVMVHVPVALFSLVALFYDLRSGITKRPSIISIQKMNEFRQRFWICSDAKARAVFGYTPEVSLKRGVRETLNWYLENQWL
ncbi:NAD-dependent epimerase/dehydratase family protein [bacterium]|nr:NAD-dependent epimerase/dehydratase family protein [bacterium]